MTQIRDREGVFGVSGVGRGRMSVALALTLLAGTAPCAAQGLTQDGADAPAGQTASVANKPAVSVDENLIVELHVKDEELANVLQMLSLQSQRNIVASQSVSASVTANLYGVTFYEALDSILHANGFGYVEKGNFIFVYTLEELAEIEQASRVRIGKVIKLNYLNAIDAAEFVKPLLSDGGQIKSNGRVANFSIPDNAPVGGEDYANESALVLYDYEENVAEIEKLLRALDTRPAQILIEATILQTQLNEANAFGVDFSIIADLDFNDFVTLGGPLKAADGLVGGQGGRLVGGSEQKTAIPGSDGEGRAISSNVGNINGPSTFKAGIVDGDVAAFLRLLDEVTDTTILSKPKLLTLNRQPARVLVGRKVGYLSTTATDTSTTQTVEFLDTGTQLYVRPFVTTEGTIRMELKPQVSEAVIRDVTDATGAAVTIPDEVTNELVANVMVRDGQTIVLGGLFRESTTATRRQVPLVGDIPLIGSAFRGHDDETQRSEIIFMITPSIVSDAVLAEQGARGEQFVESVRAGSREGLLPFSRDRQSSSLLVEAQRLAAAGETDRAMHKVTRALQLNHNQPEAIELRERLKPGTTKDWPTRSMLDDIIGNEARDAARRATPISSSTSTSGTLPQSTTASGGATASETQASAQGVSELQGETTVQPETATADASLEGAAFDQSETPAHSDAQWWESAPGQQGDMGAGPAFEDESFPGDDAEFGPEDDSGTTPAGTEPVMPEGRTLGWTLPNGDVATQRVAFLRATLEFFWNGLSWGGRVAQAQDAGGMNK